MQRKEERAREVKQREAAEQRACAAEALTTAAEQRYAAAEQRCAAAEQRAAAAERAVEALVRRLEAAERHAEREAATRLATALAAARADAEVQMGLRVDAACRDVRTACEQASTQQLHALQAAANSACVVAEDGRQAAEAACAAAERRALLAEEAHAREHARALSAEEACMASAEHAKRALGEARRERDAALSELRAAAVSAHQVALETALERSGQEAHVMVRLLE